MAVLDLRTPLPFGKYKGLTVEAVGKFNALYLLWLKQNCERHTLSAEAIEYAKPLWSREYRESMTRQEAWAWGFGNGAKRSAEHARSRAIQIECEERRKAGLSS